MELFVSRDKDNNHDIWISRPKWTLNAYREFIRGSVELSKAQIMLISPQLCIKPGQLATVNREVNDGVVTLRLGEVIESH